jgi:hypothetical protein
VWVLIISRVAANSEQSAVAESDSVLA